MNDKKKYILIGIGVVVLIALFSNIGKKEETTTQEEPKELILKAAQTTIKGDLKDCYEVVDKNYRVKRAQKSYESDVITVELLRTSKQLPYERKNVVIFPEADKSSAENCAGFGIEVLDAYGDVIAKKNANATPYSWDEMTAALQLLPEETTTIAFHLDDLSEAVSFRVTSLVTKNEERKTSLGKEIDNLVDEASSIVDEITDDEYLEDASKALDASVDMMNAAMGALKALEELSE